VTRDFWGKTEWDGKPVTVLVKGDIMRNGNNRHLNYQVNAMLECAFEMKSHYSVSNLKKLKQFRLY